MRPSHVLGDKGYSSRAIRTWPQWRGIATRYDKTTESYQAAFILAALLLWA
ncbi:hypothetical protein ACGFYV_04695 [Streptomyces sp. NPDC048297]|uniref:hypothetical protein n=1 Tax=Streptomyces sp. NPDC048297 TaxID=3365531 RepID=UPI00371A25F7